MTQKRLFSGPPVASLDVFVEVYPAAIVVLYRMISHLCPTIQQACSRQVYLAFIIMVAGLCVLSKKPTARSIAATLGVVSHDALTRMLLHACWNTTLLMDALLTQAMVLTTGTTLPSFLILDDVVIPKPFARWIAAAYWDWDHAAGRKVFCHRIVVVVWTNGVLVIPIAFALWHKKHSAYFLSSTATFTPQEYTTFLTHCPEVRSILASVASIDEYQVSLHLDKLTTWQRGLIGKTAWAGLAMHAPNHRHYRTKNEIARCLIFWVVRHGLHVEYITFDSWYASKENVNMLTRLGLVYYAAIPCSRTVSSAYRVSSLSPVSTAPQQIRTLASSFATREYTPYPQGRLRALRVFVNLTGLNHGATCVIITRRDWLQFLKRSLPDDHPIQKKKSPDPNTYLLTNNVFTPTYQVILRYRSRWAIEVMFRDLKQHLGLSACQHRNLEAVRRHIALSLCAYVCLSLIRQNQYDSATSHQSSVLTIGEVKKHLQSQTLMCLNDITNPGMIRGTQRPMPLDIFRQLTHPATATVISSPGFLLMTSPDIKELDKNA
jgi:hypothetical protein